MSVLADHAHTACVTMTLSGESGSQCHLLWDVTEPPANTTNPKIGFSLNHSPITYSSKGKHVFLVHQH